MIIKELNLQHFGKYVKLNANFNESVTYLVGPNGSGKSTIGIIGIWFALQGISQKAKDKSMPMIGDRFRFIHKDFSSATVDLVLEDLKTNDEITITRKITKDKNVLEIVSKNGRNLDQSWLDELFNAFMLSPKTFYTLSPTEQTKALGIDVSSFNKDLKDLKTDYTVINRQIRDIGEVAEIPIPIPENLDLITIQTKYNTIVSENEIIVKENTELDKVESEIKLSITNWNEGILKAKAEILELENLIKSNESLIEISNKNLTAKQAIIRRMPTPLEQIQNELQIATQSQDQINKDKEMNVKILKKLDLQNELIVNKNKQLKVDEDKNKYLTSINLKIKDLEIDDEGQLTYQGKFIREPFFSTGELIRICISLNAKRLSDRKNEDNLKYVFLQDWELLDEENQKAIQKQLITLGFQVVIEHVATNNGNKDCLILTELVDE